MTRRCCWCGELERDKWLQYSDATCLPSRSFAHTRTIETSVRRHSTSRRDVSTLGCSALREEFAVVRMNSGEMTLPSPRLSVANAGQPGRLSSSLLRRAVIVLRTACAMSRQSAGATLVFTAKSPAAARASNRDAPDDEPKVIPADQTHPHEYNTWRNTRIVFFWKIGECNDRERQDRQEPEQPPVFLHEYPPPGKTLVRWPFIQTPYSRGVHCGRTGS